MDVGNQIVINYFFQVSVRHWTQFLFFLGHFKRFPAFKLFLPCCQKFKVELAGKSVAISNFEHKQFVQWSVRCF